SQAAPPSANGSKDQGGRAYGKGGGTRRNKQAATRRQRPRRLPSSKPRTSRVSRGVPPSMREAQGHGLEEIIPVPEHAEASFISTQNWTGELPRFLSSTGSGGSIFDGFIDEDTNRVDTGLPLGPYSKPTRPLPTPRVLFPAIRPTSCLEKGTHGDVAGSGASQTTLRMEEDLHTPPRTSGVGLAEVGRRMDSELPGVEAIICDSPPLNI
ncbi:hypothetical protein FOZ63_012185, partial [Perkinsus olseni]